MPYEAAKLNKEAIASIAQWIEPGAPFDRPLIDKAEAASWTRKTIPPEARNHWAHQPLRKVEPPKVLTTSPVRTAIARFLLARLEEKGIALNPPTTK